MSPYDFNQIVNSADVEAATHEVFDQAYMKWITHGNKVLTEGEIAVYCVETTFGEVCNGGLAQYLTNESGAPAEHTPDALVRVGLPHYAEIMKELLSRCEKHFADLETDPDDPRAPYFEWDLKAETDSEPFADLDDRFYKLYFADKTEFRRKLFQYITEHESEFLTPDS